MEQLLGCGLSLRRAEPSDLQYVADCIMESLTASVTDSEAGLADLWADTTVAVAMESLSERRMDDEVFILADGTDRKGMLWMGVSRDQYTAESTGYLLGISVSKELRGRGIGKELMHAAETWCLEKGLYSMQLNVSQNNVPAYCMYKSSGYSPRSVVMTKTLKR